MPIYARWSGGGGASPNTPTGITEVTSDNTLSGNGTEGSPLSVVPRMYRNAGVALKETFGGNPQSVTIAEDTQEPIKRGEIILGSNGVWAIITSVAEADGDMVSVQYETFKPTPDLYEAILGDINTNPSFITEFGDLNDVSVSGKIEDIIENIYTGFDALKGYLQTLNT